MSTNSESLPKQVANVLQSCSGELISALTLIWAKYTCPHGSSLIFFCPILSCRLDAFISGHFEVQLYFCVSGDKSLQSHLAWSSSLVYSEGEVAAQKSQLSPTALSTQWGRTWASQWTWWERCAQHWWFTSFTVVGAGGNWSYNTCHVPATVTEELKYFAKGRKACFLGCWGLF